MARIGKAAKKKKVTLETKDYQFAGEKMAFWQGMGGVWLIFLILAGVTAYLASKPKGVGDMGLHALWHVPVILLLYPLVTIILLNYIAAAPGRKQLKQIGTKAKVMRTNRADLYKVVADQAALLCLKQEPEAYVMEDEVPYLFSVPGKRPSIIISSKCLEVLRPDEFGAAIAHEMGHIRTGHVQVDLAITSLKSQNPLLRLVFLPVTIMALFMRGWQDMIDYTADRCSLLVAGRTQVCTAMMVKLAAAGTAVTKVGKRDRKREARKKTRRGEAVTDREAAAEEADGSLAEILPEDLDAYLAGGGEMTEDPVQVERAFKISRFIQGQRNLSDRIKNLGEFLDSDEGEAALAKMDDIRAQLTGTQSASG